MWADVESEVDYLNFTELAVLVAEILKEEHLLPISIGVFGGWGTGKSSLLGLIQQRLLDGKKEKRFHKLPRTPGTPQMRSRRAGTKLRRRQTMESS